MPIGNEAPPRAPDDTLIDHLARRLGRVWNQLEPIESIPPLRRGMAGPSRTARPPRSDP